MHGVLNWALSQIHIVVAIAELRGGMGPHMGAPIPILNGVGFRVSRAPTPSCTHLDIPANFTECPN